MLDAVDMFKNFIRAYSPVGMALQAADIKYRQEKALDLMEMAGEAALNNNPKRAAWYEGWAYRIENVI